MGLTTVGEYSCVIRGLFFALVDKENMDGNQSRIKFQVGASFFLKKRPRKNSKGSPVSHLIPHVRHVAGIIRDNPNHGRIQGIANFRHGLHHHLCQILRGVWMASGVDCIDELIGGLLLRSRPPKKDDVEDKKPRTLAKNNRENNSPKWVSREIPNTG